MPNPRKAQVSRIQGSWTAEVDGITLAVIHNLWWKDPPIYFDPMREAKLDGKKYQSFVAALKNTDRVLMQKSKEDGSFRKLDYVGVFRFENLIIGDDGSIQLEIVERIPVKV